MRPHSLSIFFKKIWGKYGWAILAKIWVNLNKLGKFWVNLVIFY